MPFSLHVSISEARTAQFWAPASWPAKTLFHGQAGSVGTENGSARIGRCRRPHLHRPRINRHEPRTSRLGSGHRRCSTRRHICRAKARVQAQPFPWYRRCKLRTTAASHLIQRNIPSSISLVHSNPVILSGARPQNRGQLNYACSVPRSACSCAMHRTAPFPEPALCLWLSQGCLVQRLPGPWFSTRSGIILPPDGVRD